MFPHGAVDADETTVRLGAVLYRLEIAAGRFVDVQGKRYPCAGHYDLDTTLRIVAHLNRAITETDVMHAFEWSTIRLDRLIALYRQLTPPPLPYDDDPSVVRQHNCLTNFVSSRDGCRAALGIDDGNAHHHVVLFVDRDDEPEAVWLAGYLGIDVLRLGRHYLHQEKRHLLLYSRANSGDDDAWLGVSRRTPAQVTDSLAGTLRNRGSVATLAVLSSSSLAFAAGLDHELQVRGIRLAQGIAFTGAPFAWRRSVVGGEDVRYVDATVDGSGDEADARTLVDVLHRLPAW